MKIGFGSIRATRLLLMTTVALCPMAPAIAAEVATSAADQEQPSGDIIVTATRRSESVQRVPISMQALTPEVLEQHKVQAIDDYVKLLPSVSISTLGPGQTNLFFRGVSTGSGGFSPSSGMYFDETPVQSGGASLDLHLYDVARVEALSGPQGTLFGSNSLSGTLRIISNRPNPNGFKAGYDIQGDKFGKGDFGYTAEGFVNLPLAPNMALRVVGWYQRDGGFIDVVPGQVKYTLGDNDPSNDITKTNASQVRENVNSIDTYGARAALGIELDDRWTITPQIMAQRQKSHGTFLWDPRKGDLAVSTYAPVGNNDGWYLASLTVEGKIGNFDLVYSGSYLDRRSQNEADYTYYTVAYDPFPGYTKFPTPAGGFLDPTQHFRGDITNKRVTQELRLSSDASNPFHFTVGGFFQRSSGNTLQDYYIPGVSKLDRSQLGLPPVRGDTIFLIDTNPVNKDYAVFGEATYNLTSKLSVSGGIRLFKATSDSTGFVGTVFTALRKGCAVPLTTICDSSVSHSEASGETHKVNVTWQVDSDRMIYATYSTGFRPGGPNSLPGVKPYEPDTLTNYELGFKTFWFDRKLRVNAALYYDQWKGIQYRLATPGANGLSAVYNAGNADIYGAEVDFTARLGQFTLTGSASLNDARLTTDFCAIQSAANPNPFPTCTVAAGNVKAPNGTRLPNQPIFKGNLTGRYEFTTGQMENFLQATVNHQSGARNFLGIYENNLLGNSPGFETVDFSVGTAVRDYKIELFIQNVFDTRGELNRNTFCQITICGAVATRVYSTRPQFFGIKFSHRFN